MGDSADTRYCSNCKRDIAAVNFVMHELHCQRNITLCKQCNEPYPRSELDDHIEEVHAKISCTKCNCDVEKADIEKHEEELCSKRIVKCAYCELDLPHSDLSSHMEYCGTRTEQCHKCSQFIMHKDLNRHEDSNCQYPPKVENTENNGRSDRHTGSGGAGLFFPSSRHGVDSNRNSFVMTELDRMLDIDLHRGGRRDRTSEYGSRGQIGAERATQKTTNASSKNKNSFERSRQNKSNLTSRNTNLTQTPKQKTSNTSQRKRETDLSEGLRNQNPAISVEEDHRIAMHLAYDLGHNSDEHNLHNFSPYEPEPSQSDEFIIPCEFCGEQFPTDVLFQHQSVCSPFQSLVPVRNEGLRNIGQIDEARISPPLSQSPVTISDPSIPNNSPSRSAPRTSIHRPNILDNLHSEWEPNNRSELIDDDIMLPCEFCDEQFPLDLLVQHQSVCDANGSLTPMPVIKPKTKPPPKPRMPSTTVPTSISTSRSQRRQQDPMLSYMNDTAQASAKPSLRSNGAKKPSKKSTSEQRLTTGSNNTTPVNLQTGRYPKAKPERKHSADSVDIAGASGKYSRSREDEPRHDRRSSVKVQETLDRLITDPTYTTQDLLAHIDLEDKQEKSRLNEKQRNELEGRPRNRNSRKPPTNSSSSSQASSVYQPEFVTRPQRATKKPASKRNIENETEEAILGITGSSRIARNDRAGAREKKPSTRPRNYPQGDM